MKRVNSLLSIEKIKSIRIKDRHNSIKRAVKVAGHIRNNDKTEIIEVQAKNENISFSEFFRYCIELYEIYLCAYCDIEYFMEFASSIGMEDEKALDIFEHCEEIANKLENVYGRKLYYFIRQFMTNGAKICGTEFVDGEDKLNYLINAMEYRLIQKEKGNELK